MSESFDRLVRLREVVKLLSISRANVYRLMKIGKFPKSTKLTERTVVWRLSELEAWIQEKSAGHKTSK
jgi:prophage regulatory protein